MAIEIPFDTGYTFDENLHEVPDDPGEMARAVDFLEARLGQASMSAARLEILGLLGSFCRILMRLDEAVAYLEAAVQLAQETGDGRARLANVIRLAHAYQWQGRFGRADYLYNLAIAESEARDDLRDYLPFAVQHAGKSHFDQGDYETASEFFRLALDLREAASAPTDQLASSRLALDTALQRLREDDTNPTT